MDLCQANPSGRKSQKLFRMSEGCQEDVRRISGWYLSSVHENALAEVFAWLLHPSWCSEKRECFPKKIQVPRRAITGIVVLCKSICSFQQGS